MEIAKRCYSCKNLLDLENKSEEHIIPNSIGGKIKSYWLLCRNCNSRFGNTIDSDFAKSYEDIVAMLNLKRDRPKEYIVKNLKSSDGESYHLINGRSPTPVKPTINIDREDNKLQITARDRAHLDEIISGLKRKFPNLDDSKLEEKLSGQNTYLESPLTLKMKFGGEGYLLALAKMAVNFYLYQGGNQIFLKEIIDVLNKKVKIDDHIHFCYIDQEVVWKEEEVSHQIYIKGNKEERLLYAYIILFSSNAFIVNLSNDYHGEDIEMGICYDVLRNINLEKIIKFNYQGRHNFKLEVQKNGVQLNRLYISSIQNNLNRVMNISNIIQTKESMKELNKTCLDEILKKHGDQKIFTKAMLDEYINLLSARTAAFYVHMENQNAKLKNRSV